MLTKDEFDLICRVNGKAIAGLVEKRLVAVKDQVMSELHQFLASMPKPVDGARGEKGDPGEKGEPGHSVSVDDVKPVVADLVAKAVAEIPRPKDGERGEKGEPGQSVTIDDVLPLVTAAVQKAVAEIPAPKDGIDGVSPSEEHLRAVAQEAVRSELAEYLAKRNRVGLDAAFSARVSAALGTKIEVLALE